jgi:hypothetical protein
MRSVLALLLLCAIVWRYPWVLVLLLPLVAFDLWRASQPHGKHERPETPQAFYSNRR